MREIKNKYEIPVTIRKVKVKKRMRKLTNGTDAVVKELTVQRQRQWRTSLLSGDDGEGSRCWAATTVFGPPSYSLVKAILGKENRSGSRYSHKRRMAAGFHFFLRKLCPCSIKNAEENGGRGSRSGKGKVKKNVGKKMQERKYNDATLEKEASLSIFLQSRSFCFFRF